jgi:REP element-mobilizing transposase RayT
MGRTLRPNLPGRAFHLTTRIQGKEHRFTAPLRDRVVERLAIQVGRSDLRLVAFAIMSNHLHLVVIQGGQPLDSFMQPLLRSVALAINHADGTEGHVFERRFHDVLCRDDAQLCNAIAYTHANPVRANLCADPAHYRWSSHRLYSGSAAWRSVLPAVDVARGLEAFIKGRWPGGRRGRAAYAEYFATAVERVLEEDERGPEDCGCLYPDLGHDLYDDPPGLQRPSLEAIAAELLGPNAGSDPLALIRTRWGPRSRLPNRDRIAAAAARAGYKGVEIARFLGISETTVSTILCRGVVLGGFGPGR